MKLTPLITRHSFETFCLLRFKLKWLLKLQLPVVLLLSALHFLCLLPHQLAHLNGSQLILEI